MKLKKRFKTALGAIMAAVMVVTAVPVTGNVVQAAETVQSEEITEETPESLSEETQQDSRTQTEEQQQYDEEKNESQADEETTEERGTEQNTDVKKNEQQTEETESEDQTEQETEGEETKVVKSDGSYAGPTIDNDGGVTFYYVNTENNDGVSVKGSWNWGTPIPLVKDGDTSIWKVTVPVETIGWKSVEYGFQLDSYETSDPSNGWRNDAENPNSNGNSKINRNPEVNSDGDVTLYYYPAHGTYPSTVNVKYQAVTDESSAAETTKPMSRESGNAYYSITLKDLEEGDYQYCFEIDSNVVQDTNNPEGTGKFTVIAKGYLGPTINYDPSTENGNDPGAVTFYFDGSAEETVVVKGSWVDGWGDKIGLGKDAGADLYSVEVPTSKIKKTGTYEYGFETGASKDENGVWNGTWSKDTANPNVKGNSKIYRNPQVSDNNEVMLYYYPSHGAYPSKVSVKYRGIVESGENNNNYSTLEMTRDSLDTAIYSVKMSDLEVGDYEYYFEVISGEGEQENKTEIQDTNNPAGTGKFEVRSEYLGPTINYNPSAEGDNDPGAVTFYFDGSAAEAVIVKGAWDASWGDKIKLEKDEGTGLYQVEIPTSKLTTIGTYEYGFETGSTQNEEGIWSGTWSVDTKNPHKDGNSRIYRNPQVDKDNNVTLYYYPAHGTYPDKVAVKYREKTESGDSSYTELEMVRDDIDAAVYSASISNAKVNAVYEYYFEVTADGKTTEIQDTNNATTGEFALVDYPEEPEGLTSPVVEGSQVTFNYYDPQAESQGKTVSVAGDWTSWEKNPVEMEYNSGTGVWSVTCTLSKGEHEYKFIVGNDWKVDPKNERKTESSDPNSIVEVTAGGVSEYPAIEGNKITFSYVNDALADDEQVSVVGSMNGWTKHAPEYMMQKNAESGEWELTVSLSPGVYSYKFFYGDSSSDDGWTSDIRNTNPLTDDKDKNNQFFVAGLEHGKTDIARGGNVKLPPALKLYDIEGNSEEVTVTYAFSDETAGAAYKDNITLDGVNLSITGDFPEDVKSFTLTAADGNNNTSVVTVSVVDAVYSYTIYYYDRDESHRSTDASALWIWNEVKAGEVSADGGTEHNFDEAVELSDGNTWLKATVKLSYTELGIIPKNKGNGSWIWQESTRTYTNADASEEVTLYIVNDDGTKIYTELPEVKPILPRYLVAEYTRTTQTNADWYFYTWNSGYGSDVFVKFEDEDKDGTGTALIPVKQGLGSISFCLERTDETTGEHWGEKDGTDYYCVLPVDQNIIKIKIEEGKGITYVYPYNTGYEIEPAEDTIHFYYRDDDSFLAGSEGGFASVNLEIAVKDEAGILKKAENGMSYDAEEQRYEYDMPDLEPGTYYYRYFLKKNEDSEGTYALDGFNDKKETIDGVEYSVCTYEFYDAALEASLQNDSMDYNDNNVLTVTLAAKDSDGKEVDASDIVSRAAVDLSAVGGGITEIDPELMELSISVRDTTSVGTKTLPVTVYDKYNNEYTTEVNLNVTSRTNSSHVDDDFDWDEAVIYFTVTDRFFDGNPSNNNGNAAGSYDNNPETGCSSYHGGDFAGLTQKLDYLQDLGVNTIWITPIVENQLAANSVDNPAVTKAWGYHGYWAKNFENLDAHLGTEAEFKALLDAAHARGIKIMVDVVLNHSGYGDDITNYFNNYPTDDGTLRMLRNNDEVVSGSDQKASLSGLPDFLTENAEVRELLVEWQSNWISKYDIDYYRVDTVKHVDETTWSAFKNALTQINPDFKMIGEYAGGGYATDAGMLRTGRMDSLLDFDYNDKALAFVTGDISGTESFLTARNAAIDNTSTLGAFLSSHDEDGFVYKLTDTTGKYNYNKTKEEAEALAKVAASLQLTTKGQVVIYYGEEIGLTGAENYPYNTNRYDFDWSQTDASANNTTLKHYKKLLDIRNRYSKVLAKGTRKTIEADNSRGLDVFTRSYSGTTLTVALNITNAPIDYTLTGQGANAYLYDYYSGMQYQANAGGELTIKIPAAAEGGTVVLVEKQLGNAGETVDSDTVNNSFDIESVADQIYTGKNIVLSEEQLKVYDGSRKMKLGTDYAVSYKNNKNAGTATVTVKGKGNYSGKETKEFEILPKDLGDVDVDIQYNADMLLSKKVQKPVTKITYNGMKLATKDYQVTYYPLDAATGERKAALTTAGVKEAGVYEVVLTGGKSKNYAGEVVMKVEVHEKGTLMSKTKITLSFSKAECTGYPIRPGVTVKENQADVSSANYTVSYKNNVNVGTATVTITGKPAKGYYGSIAKTFKITGKALSSVAVIDSAKWQSSIVYDFSKGRAEQPKDALTLLQKNSSSPAVALGKDYTVAYSKNTAPGTATVSFTGKGMYTGTLKKTFKITPIDFTTVPKEKLTYKVQETVPYAKKGAVAGVMVEYDGVMLRQGVDYKLAYSNNKAVTTSATNKKPTVKITGTGKFTGVLANQEFAIVKADLAQSDLAVEDVVFQDKAGKFISTPVLDGAKIKAAEFTTEYWLVNYDDAGNEIGTELKDDAYTAALNSTIRVKVTAVESNTKYKGEITKDYRVVNKSVSSASVKIQVKAYTGKQIKLTGEDFTKIKVGSNDLILGTDYVIIDSSYTNNINKGTASVTIKGIGNYGGTKKVTFKITTREFIFLECGKTNGQERVFLPVSRYVIVFS